MSEYTSNSVYKLTMDHLQLVYINVLIISVFNTKVSQDSVSTRLRVDRIFHDHVRYTLTAESDGERISKISQNLSKLWARVLFVCSSTFLCHPVHVQISLEQVAADGIFNVAQEKSMFYDPHYGMYFSYDPATRNRQYHGHVDVEKFSRLSHSHISQLTSSEISQPPTEVDFVNYSL